MAYGRQIIVRCRLQQFLNPHLELYDLRETRQHLSPHALIALAHIRADAFAPKIDRMKMHIQYLLAHVLGEFIENVAVIVEGHGRGQ